MNPVDGGLPPAGVEATTVVRLRGGRVERGADWLAVETPVALVFNGHSHAVMLATPADLDEFGLGFARTEGLLADMAELHGIEVHPVEAGIEVQLTVTDACLARVKARGRAMAGRTGCGLCGAETLAQVRRELPPAPPVRVAPTAVARAQRALRLKQAVLDITGAVHAAAWCSRDGDVHLVREDVGRHNALDKLVGAMTRAVVDPTDGFVCITSRASFEMVQKTVMAGAGVLAAVSAPTAFAVQIARDHGLALAGFARGDDCVAYTYPERFGLVV